MFAILTPRQLEELDTFPVCSSCGCYISQGLVGKSYDNDSLHHWDECIAPELIDEDIESIVSHYERRLQRERAREEVTAN